jgi:hypothetical protein
MNRWTPHGSRQSSLSLSFSSKAATSGWSTLLQVLLICLANDERARNRYLDPSNLRMTFRLTVKLPLAAVMVCP